MSPGDDVLPTYPILFSILYQKRMTLGSSTIHHSMRYLLYNGDGNRLTGIIDTKSAKLCFPDGLDRSIRAN